MKSTSSAVPRSTAKKGYFATPVVADVPLSPSTAKRALALDLAVQTRRYKAWSHKPTGEEEAKSQRCNEKKAQRRVDRTNVHLEIVIIANVF